MEEIKGEITVQDYLRANRLHMASSRLFRVQIIIFSFLTLLYIFLTFINPFNVLNWLFLILCFLYSTYSYTILPWTTRYYYKIQKQIHGEIIISSDGTYICAKSERGETTIKWAFKYLSSDDTLLIYNTPKTFVVIPKRFCKDDEQFNRFINIAKNLTSK